MGSKVTISVEEGAAYGVRATRVSTTTGQEYESVSIEAGKDHAFDLDDEENVVVQRGQATPQEEPKEGTGKKSKA